MTVDLCERQLLPQPVALPLVAGRVRLREEERVGERVEFLLGCVESPRDLRPVALGLEVH
jgi:hypothetical protein